MKTVGIIAEYNPFHNGHKYQLDKAKEITGADYCIIVMSGNFVQRGTPAIMDKYTRTNAALKCGADLVIELPIYYATASAEYFAFGAIALLDKLGVTDCLCFGSECGDIKILSDIADVLIEESGTFKQTLKQHLKEGASYPRARNQAVCSAAPYLAEHIDVLNHPNNILGLEYIKALKKRGSKIVPYTISRHGADYHNPELNYSCSSALAIRESIVLTHGINFIKAQVPDCVYQLMEDNFLKTFPILPDDITFLLHYKLLQEQETGFEQYFDIDAQFSDKLRRYFPVGASHSTLCESLKSKNMTYTRISRNLLHILLNIYQSDIKAFCLEDYVYYARMLGFRKDATPLLSELKAVSSLPLISKLADAASHITAPNGIKMLNKDIEASHLYSLTAQNKFNLDFRNEYTKQIVIN